MGTTRNYQGFIRFSNWRACTWVDTGHLLTSLAIGRSYQPHVYSAPSMCFPIKGVASVPSHLSFAMLFLIFIYYLVRGVSESIDASPIPSFDLLSSESNRCTNLTHCRMVWNIIWSCLATIFSCTWVAVHPNIPCPRKRSLVVSFAEHRLPLFICALLVPEYVLAWAIRQYLRARSLAKNNRRE